MTTGEEQMPRDIPQGYAKLLPIWNNLAKSLQTTYVVLGLIATVSSLVVATFTAELGSIGVKVISFALSLSIGLITAFDIGAKANAARGAWRLLYAATIAYAEDTSFTIQDLHKQYLAGEALLGDIKYNAPSEKPAKPQDD
jgi:hypothetical protein